MQPLFDIDKIKEYDRDEKMPFLCERCFNIFYIEAGYIDNKKSNTKVGFKYCSRDCSDLAISMNKVLMSCANCNKNIIILCSQRKKSKSGRSFCNQSCAAKYNNAHKTKGTRRSKLENWLENKLKTIYTDLDIKFNDKQTINSELDIYIPSLNLAFELNGIFHYEPIYGSDKLSDIQNNDDRKFQACLEQNIELVIIDTSDQSYFKESSSKKYLDIITNIINLKLQSSIWKSNPCV